MFKEDLSDSISPRSRQFRQEHYCKDICFTYTHVLTQDLKNDAGS